MSPPLEPSPGRAARRRVAVLDPRPQRRGDGRARRRFGLYHALGGDLDATLVTPLDEPGAAPRATALTPALRAVATPLAAEHLACAAAWTRRTGGAAAIESTFALQAYRSGGFVDACRRAVRAADVVVLAHPAILPFVGDRLRPGQLLVYDAHDVEAVLEGERLADTRLGAELWRRVVRLERALCRRADLVLCASAEDRDAFARLFGVPDVRLAVLPNGAFVERVRPTPIPVRAAAREALGLDGGPLALFVGDGEPAALEAARFLVERVAPATPAVAYAIAGPVCAALAGAGARPPSNVRCVGELDDDGLALHLEAAEIAPYPLVRGRGVDLELAAALAAGVAVTATPRALRDLAHAEDAVRPCAPHELAGVMAALAADPYLRSRMGRAGRRLAEERHAWEHLSPALGALLRRRLETKGLPRPRFSVVVPTYERPAAAARLRHLLRRQTLRSFEVVVVDQSPEPEAVGAGADFVYVHTRPPSIARARNLGAFLAGGEILAFTDDDCRPLPDWLAKADRHFDDPRTDALEGRILSHGYDDPAMRPVANAGLEGVGFMTANLFVRRGEFLAAGGFDERFTTFREDTDLGWRIAPPGRLPFAHDAIVYHPPHPAGAARAPAFALDALLLRKHPRRFPLLLALEGRWRQAGYRAAILAAAAEHGIAIDLDRLLLARPTRLRDPRAGLAFLGAVPPRVGPGQVFDLALRARNESDAAWASALAGEPLAVNASYRWLGPSGAALVDSGVRTPLPWAVWPGEVVELQLRVRAPETAGLCELLVTMVQEGAAWFDTSTHSVVRAWVEVTGGPRPGRAAP